MDSLRANRLNVSWLPRISCSGPPEADVSRKNIVAHVVDRGFRNLITPCTARARKSSTMEFAGAGDMDGKREATGERAKSIFDGRLAVASNGAIALTRIESLMFRYDPISSPPFLPHQSGRRTIKLYCESSPISNREGCKFSRQRNERAALMAPLFPRPRAVDAPMDTRAVRA
jgi:hypothetical protein